MTDIQDNLPQNAVDNTTDANGGDATQWENPPMGADNTAGFTPSAMMQNIASMAPSQRIALALVAPGAPMPGPAGNGDSGMGMPAGGPAGGPAAPPGVQFPLPRTRTHLRAVVA